MYSTPECGSIDLGEVNVHCLSIDNRNSKGQCKFIIDVVYLISFVEFFNTINITSAFTVTDRGQLKGHECINARCVYWLMALQHRQYNLFITVKNRKAMRYNITSLFAGVCSISFVEYIHCNARCIYSLMALQHRQCNCCIAMHGHSRCEVICMYIVLLKAFLLMLIKSMYIRVYFLSIHQLQIILNNIKYP